MKRIITLRPVKATREIMQMLEDKGLIIRLCPGHHELGARKGEMIWDTIYSSDERYGSHKLVTVTVNCELFVYFGTHPENEEFLLIGHGDTKPLYLVVALCQKEELSRKILDNELEDDDFITLDTVYNNPELSFFTMLKDVPHGEFTSGENGKPPSFYVTEPTNLTTELTDFGCYNFKVLKA